MGVRPAIGQVWEEVDARKTVKRRFVIVEFMGWKESEVGCVRYYGMKTKELLPNPKTGRKPRRFYLRRNELDGRHFCFSGDVVETPSGLHGYPPSKSYGLKG